MSRGNERQPRDVERHQQGFSRRKFLGLLGTAGVGLTTNGLLTSKDSRAETLVVPEAVSWRDYCPDIATNQFGGDCVFVATEMLLRVEMQKATNKRYGRLGCPNQPAYNKEVDEDNLNPNSLTFWNNGADTSNLIDTLTILKQHGICRNYLPYNYVDGYIDRTTKRPLSDQQIQEAARLKPTSVEYLAGTIDNIGKNVITEMQRGLVEGPVIIQFNYHPSLEPIDLLWKDNLRCPTGVTSTNHASVVVGYDNYHLNTEGDSGAFLVRPWGNSFPYPGSHGFCFLPYSAISFWERNGAYFSAARTIFDDKSGFFPVDQVVTPTPKPEPIKFITYLPSVTR